jgi:glucose-6-phosphate-specific signal transduction histidine kinase
MAQAVQGARGGVLWHADRRIRERVAALNGDMRLQSQLGQGCKLLVVLPLKSTPASTPPPNQLP